MNTALFPQAIQEVLEAVQSYEGSDIWSDVLKQYTDERDRELTSSFCSADCADFIVMDGDDAFLFDYNEQTDAWSVSHVGKPVYNVKPEMIGDDSIDFDEFIQALGQELPGVKVVNGSALRNLNSEFVQEFADDLNKAFEVALESVSE